MGSFQIHFKFTYIFVIFGILPGSFRAESRYSLYYLQGESRDSTESWLSISVTRESRDSALSSSSRIMAPCMVYNRESLLIAWLHLKSLEGLHILALKNEAKNYACIVLATRKFCKFIKSSSHWWRGDDFLNFVFKYPQIERQIQQPRSVSSPWLDRSWFTKTLNTIISLDYPFK